VVLNIYNIYFYLSVAAAFFTAAAFAYLVTPAVKIFAFKIGAVDVAQDERRMHKEALARLGGLAIFLGFCVSTAFFAVTTPFLNASLPIIGILIGATLIVALGVVDDVTVLKAKKKLLVQIIAASIPVIMGVRIDILTNFYIFTPSSYESIEWISIPLTIIWIVGITNAVNLLDGLDGLAAGVSSISSISVLVIMLFIHDSEMAILTAALAGACVGFLPFNFNPAKIIMGDTGATFLGFIMATISVQGLFKSYLIVSLAVPFLVLALPIFDTIYAIIRRIREGRSPMSADREHIHHRLMDLGFSHKNTVRILYIASTVLALFAVIITTMSRYKALVFSIITFAIILSAIWYISRKGKHFKK